MPAKLITKIILEKIICNFSFSTQTKNYREKIAFRVGNGNFEDSKIIRGSGNFEKEQKSKPHNHTHDTSYLS